jgi:hypothetical protein
LLVLPTLLLTGCGGGGSSAGTTTTPPPPPLQNVANITVDSGPAALKNGEVNFPYVSVTICAPGTAQCQTIDHVQVDTGSSGFRIISSVLTASLPAQTIGGQPVFECLPFADGYVWGPVVMADLKIGGETASSVPIQVMGTSQAVPADCSANQAGPEEDTLDAFGANAILGVSSFIQDCGAFCANPAQKQSGAYYTCSAASCTDVVEPLAQQVPNPVSMFPTDNNGVIMQLQSIGDNGASTTTGTLTFGIGTQSNNAVPNSVTVLFADDTDSIQTTYPAPPASGTTFKSSYIDSGSNGLFFNDSTIATCPSTGAAPGFFCPASTQSLSALNMSGTGLGTGMTSTVNFKIANADTLLNDNPTGVAFNNIGAPASKGQQDVFDWGLPFFYGRTVYFAIEGKTTSAGTGPYYAY